METVLNLRRITHKGTTGVIVVPGINKVQTATEQGTSLMLCYSLPIKVSRRSGSTI